MPISRDVLRRAEAEPQRPAIVGPCGVLDFADLTARARRQATLLPETRIVLDDADPVDLLVGLVAADLAGLPAVVVDHAWPRSLRDAAVAAADRVLVRHQGDGRLVVFSSGTTGTPKPVVRTTASWTHSFPSFSAITGACPDDTVLIPGAMSGSLFLFGAVHALTLGAAVHPLPRWSRSQASQAARQCSVVHLVPTMLAALADDLPDRSSPRSGRPSDPPSRLRLVICAGAELPAEVESTAREHGLEVVEYYGAAELSLVGYRTRPRDDAGPGRFKPFPGVEVAIDNGVLRARSPYLSLSVERDADGFATVGDRGAWVDGQGFVVHGRPDQAIHTGGSTVDSEGVERFLRTLPAVADVAVVGMPHAELGQVVAAVIEPAGDDLALSGLRAAAAQGLAPQARPRFWYATDRLPRTGSGKPARAQILAGLCDGTLSARLLT